MPTQDDLPTKLPPLHTRFSLGTEVTAEQQAFLDHYGFLHFEQVARPEEIQRMTEELERVEATWLEGQTRFVFGVPLFLGKDWNGKPYVQRFAFTTRFSSWMRTFFEDPRFDPVRRLIGEDARVGQDEKDGVVVNRFLNVPGTVHKRLGWHTDGLRDIFNLRLPPPQLNVGLHLDDISEADGGLRILPATHKQGFFSTCFRKFYFLYHRPDPGELAVETRAGDLTVHDGRLWHRVAQSTRTGQRSLRRAIYVPYLTGPYEPKDDQSTTPPYHHVGRLIRWFRGRIGFLLVTGFLAAPAQAALPSGLAVEEGSLAGTFALQLVTAERVDLPLFGERDAGGVNYSLVQRSWDARAFRYVQETQVCRVVNNEVGGTLILIPDATCRVLPSSSREVVEIVHGVGNYRMVGHRQLWGFRGPAPFPESADEARGHAGTYDMDQDGHPGITMRSEGLVDGDIYGVQSKKVSLRGVVLGVDRVVGVSQVEKVSWVIGGSNYLVRTLGPKRVPHPDPMASWFEEIRLPEGADCEVVLQAAQSKQLSARRPF